VVNLFRQPFIYQQKTQLILTKCVRQLGPILNNKLNQIWQ